MMCPALQVVDVLSDECFQDRQSQSPLMMSPGAPEEPDATIPATLVDGQPDVPVVVVLPAVEECREKLAKRDHLLGNGPVKTPAPPPLDYEKMAEELTEDQIEVLMNRFNGVANGEVGCIEPDKLPEAERQIFFDMLENFVLSNRKKIVDANAKPIKFKPMPKASPPVEVPNQVAGQPDGAKPPQQPVAPTAPAVLPAQPAEVAKPHEAAVAPALPALPAEVAKPPDAAAAPMATPLLPAQPAEGAKPLEAAAAPLATPALLAQPAEVAKPEAAAAPIAPAVLPAQPAEVAKPPEAGVAPTPSAVLPAQPPSEVAKPLEAAAAPMAPPVLRAQPAEVAKPLEAAAAQWPLLCHRHSLQRLPSLLKLLRPQWPLVW